MILAKPLVGSAGNILLNEGVVLKTTIISRLKNWDVPFVTVQSGDEQTEEPVTAVPVEFKTEVLDTIFTDVIKNPIMKIIYEATRDYFRSKNTKDKDAAVKGA